MNRLLIAAAAFAVLAGCSAQEQANEAGPNELMSSAETRTGGSEPDTMAAVPVDPATAARLMKERHDNYEKIGDAMKVITRELKLDNPDLAQVRQSADTIATLAPQVPSWFPAGTGPEAGKTEAKAEIWQRPEDFRAKAQAFEQAANAFRAAAQGSDVAAMRTAQANLGKSCKACHDLYREEH